MDLSETHSLLFIRPLSFPSLHRPCQFAIFFSIVNHIHAIPSQDTEAGGAVALGLQSICNNLLHHMMSLVRQEVVGKLSLVGVAALIPRGVPDSSIDLDARDTQRGLIGGKVTNCNVKHAKGGAILLTKVLGKWSYGSSKKRKWSQRRENTYQVLVANALKREGEGGVQRPCPRVVGAAKGRSLKVGNCRAVGGQVSKYSFLCPFL